MQKMKRILGGVVLAFATLAGEAVAGEANAGALKATLFVVDDNATSWAEDMSGLLTFDAATGQVGLLAGSPDQTFGSDPMHQDWAWGTREIDGQTVSGWFWTAHGTNVLEFGLTSVEGNVDPYLSYGFYARNSSGITQTYTVSIGEAIMPPVSSANTVTATVSGGLANPAGSLTIAPGFADSDGDGIDELQRFKLSADGGVSFVNAGVDVGPAFSTVAFGAAYGPYADSKAGPLGAWNYMELETRFTLSSGNDVASLAGYAEITPVPEPGSYVLMLAGLGLIGAMARRRRR